MVSVVLVGLPASGKTTVGMALAARLGVDFVDTDHMVEQATGQSIGEIFASQGEETFRALEEEATVAALQETGVVCLGGGAIMNSRIRELLAGLPVVWLDVSVTTLTRRAGMNKLRPLLLGDIRDQLTSLAQVRLPAYEEVATWRVDGESPVDVVVSQIIDLISDGDPVDPPTNGDLVDSSMADGPRTIHVTTDHPYDVLIGHGVVSKAAEIIGSVSRTAILYPSVLNPQAIRLATTMPSPIRVEVPDGEEAKTADVLNWCWITLAQAGVTRSDAVIGFGGGSTTDLAGFVAATMLRGMTYLSIPTTVLGMADASLGGKTGINLSQGKNLVGAFYEPRAVLCDLDLLDTLPAEEVRSGLGEIVKCGFIADPEILNIAERDPSRLSDTRTENFAEALRRAISVKAEVVSADFRENSTTGVGREALNYGHTLAHAIEKVEGFTWSHGYAVAVGMVFAAEVAHRLGMIDEDVVARHRQILTSVGLPIQYSSAPWAEIRQAMSVDKKARGSHLRLVLLEGIGSVRVVPDVDEDLLRDSFLAVGGVE